jgi:hypothetical protein
MAMPSKAKSSSKQRPANSSIIRNALIKTLALELEYQRSSILGEIGTESERPTDFNTHGDCLKMSLHPS